MAKKTSSDLVDDLAGIGEEIRNRAIAETRKDVAEAIEDQFLGGKSRAVYCGRSADDCVLDALTDPAMRDRRLQALVERFKADGVSGDLDFEL